MVIDESKETLHVETGKHDSAVMALRKKAVWLL
jgi:hypothetical protein